MLLLSILRRSVIAGIISPTFEERVLNRRCGKQITTLQMNADNTQNSQKQIDADYEEAIRVLNTLQSNAQTISNLIAAKNRYTNLADTVKFLNRSGLSLEDIDQLSVIHVSGTKGKGSTCAITESILRAHNVKTGFFSSPHLVAATERIRINGEPICKQKFTKAFWRVYKRLKAAETSANDMPAYFKFLTILCFHIFLEEKVDVTVLEVGIGGELDCTNVVRNTKIVGITSLGLEHTDILGNTLEDIAWQKSGIIKRGSNVYTHVTQPECLQVIKERAKEKNASVYVVPEFSIYKVAPENAAMLESLNDSMQLNGSLGIQLAYDWLRNNRNDFSSYDINSTLLTPKVVEGLTNCHWPGRCQIINYHNFIMHLDGAHTVESMQVCVGWFKKVTKSSTNPTVVLFNRTGTTDSLPLLRIIFEQLRFDCICFVPNIAKRNDENRKDIQTVRWQRETQLERATFHANNWLLLCTQASTTNNSNVFPAVTDFFDFLNKKYNSKENVNVLVTGSLHLIGTTICALNDYADCAARKQ